MMRELTGCASEDDDEWYQSDLQLAAELGKTLLERNQELESSLRQQQRIIEEQTREINVLTKQASTLREVNDSRLKVYEQLELSISELERNNDKLQKESTTDKKRIKSLCNNIDALELKCEELQDLVESLKNSSEQQDRPKQLAPSLVEHPTVNLLRRVQSLESGLWCPLLLGKEEFADDADTIRLKKLVSCLKCQLAREQQQRDDLETELNFLVQENSVLQDELYSIQEKDVQSISLHALLAAEQNGRGRPCPSCQRRASQGDDDSHSVLDSDVESEEPVSVGDCAVVQLKNGGYAYGSQESLQSVGNVVDTLNDNNVSLLNELDTQYRVLIEKYEALLNARRQSLGDDQHRGSLWPLAETDAESKDDVVELDMKNGIDHQEPTEDLSVSEVVENCPRLQASVENQNTDSQCTNLQESFSVDKEMQTEPSFGCCLELCCRNLHMPSSSSNPLAGHFSHGPPEYKKLFEEIFAVLKRSLHGEPSDCTPRQDLPPPAKDLPKEQTESLPIQPKSLHPSQPPSGPRTGPRCRKCKKKGRPVEKPLPELLPPPPPPSSKQVNVSVRLCERMTYAEVLARGKQQRKPTNQLPLSVNKPWQFKV